MEAFRMEAQDGRLPPAHGAGNLQPSSLTLASDERSFCCLASGRLLSVNLGNEKVKEVYRSPDGYEHGSGLSLAEDGLYALDSESADRKEGIPCRLRLIRMADGTATTLAETNQPEGGEMRDPIIRPRRASVLYSHGYSSDAGLWLANFDAQQNYRLHLAEGETGPANWSPDGRSVLYLNFPPDPHRLHNIREFTPDTNADAASPIPANSLHLNE